MKAQNELEQLLMAPRREEQDFVNIFEALLQNDVYVPGEAEAEQLDSPQEVSMQHWCDGNDENAMIIPCFSSLAVFDQVTGSREGYIKIPCYEFLTLLNDVEVVVNPNTPYSFSISSNDIRLLLGEIQEDYSESYLLESMQELVLSEVLNKPKALIEQITPVLAEFEQVQEAYIATMRQPEKDNQENLLIGIKANTQHDVVIERCISAIHALKASDLDYPNVDFLQLKDDDSQIGDFMIRHTRPIFIAGAPVSRRHIS